MRLGWKIYNSIWWICMGIISVILVPYMVVQLIAASVFFPIGIIFMVLAIYEIKERRELPSLVHNRSAFLKAQPFFCEKCKTFTDTFREYCEDCGTEGSLRKATKADYKQYIRIQK